MHLAKHMQFHGVDYVVVPVDLWNDAKGCVSDCINNGDGFWQELYDNMKAYDNSNEPEEIPNE